MLTISMFAVPLNLLDIMIFTIIMIFQVTIIIDKNFQYRQSIFSHGENLSHMC